MTYSNSRSDILSSYKKILIILMVARVLLVVKEKLDIYLYMVYYMTMEPCYERWEAKSETEKKRAVDRLKQTKNCDLLPVSDNVKEK
jgi:hypothetical protein